jgi:hypothetical protein
MMEALKVARTINIRAGDVKGQHHHEGGLGWG